MPGPSKKMPHLTNEFAELWASNHWTLPSIAEKYGVSVSTVQNWARKFNLPRRTTGPKKMLEYHDSELTGGRWETKPNGVQIWIPDQQEEGAA